MTAFNLYVKNSAASPDLTGKTRLSEDTSTTTLLFINSAGFLGLEVHRFSCMRRTSGELYINILCELVAITSHSRQLALGPDFFLMYSSKLCDKCFLGSRFTIAEFVSSRDSWPQFPQVVTSLGQADRVLHGPKHFSVSEIKVISTSDTSFASFHLKLPSPPCCLASSSADKRGRVSTPCNFAESNTGGQSLSQGLPSFDDFIAIRVVSSLLTREGTLDRCCTKGNQQVETQVNAWSRLFR